MAHTGDPQPIERNPLEGPRKSLENSAGNTTAHREALIVVKFVIQGEAQKTITIRMDGDYPVSVFNICFGDKRPRPQTLQNLDAVIQVLENYRSEFFWD